MNYEDWYILVGDSQEREWNNRKYRFYIGSEQQDEMRVIDSLQSNTPIKNFVETATDDLMIRTIAFLSYYNTNPTFKNEGDEVGTGFFWFPLDYLNDERYRLLSKRLQENEEGDEDEESEEDDEEDAPLPDFPIMSTVSQPVVDAAISDDYINETNRASVETRKEKLQEEIKQRKRERVDELEEWLEEGFRDEPYPRDLSAFAEVVDRLPAAILLKLIDEERSRIDNIYEVFNNIETSDDMGEDVGPSLLLNKLNKLAEDYPAFESPAIEAFCLDEQDRDCSYHVTKNRGHDVEDTLTKCENCGSELFRLYRTGLDERVRDAWMMGLLPELVVARLLSEAEWTEEVIPHRMVQMNREDGSLSSGVEVDISVRTTNDEAIFFEVTSQREALDRLNRKREKFRNNEIEFDALVQVAPVSNSKMIPFGDGAISVGGWMIKGLETDEFYEDLGENLNTLSSS